ncbi:hypothetical protein [Metapseudomonas resinovorans]|uniref:hypothetical protein n=1 Tax=Metapseudomonas resinovorans TaxID=53412 RepID=UPI0004190E34|nr:hypothetical protein [Pseudomonas resinovorans]MDE3739988.1 hypothetical protein [Pseudomonas resinovorans]
MEGNGWLLLAAAGTALAAALLVRGMAGLAIARFKPGYNGARFWIVSSLASLVLGGLYLTGTLQTWPRL